MQVLHNAHILTMDPGQPVASAALIENGRIAALGGEEVLKHNPRVERLNLAGRFILPGLVDSHLHLQQYALQKQKINCELPAKEAILSLVSETVKKTPPGRWILGHGWNQNTWGGEWPTADELNEIAPNNPVYLTAKSLHAGWASTSALHLAGIRQGSPDPGDGCIMRLPDGRPNGILLESALELVDKIIPTPNPDELAVLFRQILPSLWERGLTGVHNFDRDTSHQALQILQAEGALHLRVLQAIAREEFEQACLRGITTGSGDDFLKIGPLKLFADGALGPHTGAMLDPYINEPENYGMLLLSSTDIHELGVIATRAGISLAIHAIGDRANREVLAGFSRLRDYEQEHRLPTLRHRIEHVQVLHPDDIGRLAELGILASMQPFHVVSDMDMADRSWGDRSGYAYAWNALHQNGTTVIFGSDAPVENPDPFLGLYAAITRRRPDGTPSPEGWRPEQRITIQEALQAYTTNPAFAAGMEDRLGILARGYYADLIVLDFDPMHCDPSVFLHARPWATMVNGKWVWQAGGMDTETGL